MFAGNMAELEKIISNLDSLPSLRSVVDTNNLKAKKSLGQNFLFDQNITDKIARAAGDLTQSTVIEIGPGPGGLTRSLLRAGAKKLVAIEFDERAIKALKPLIDASMGRLTVIHSDALKSNLLEIVLEPNRKIVANLPYNIGTVLLTNWLKQVREDKNAYESMTLMFQKEVAERISAEPSTKQYGRLAVISNWLCNSMSMFDLPPTAFSPPPKVTSSIVNLVPKSLPPNSPYFKSVEDVTREAFNQRRKMIRSSLKNYKEIIEELGIETTKRAENISVEEFIDIASKI